MEAEPLYRVHAGEDPLLQPVHDTGGSPEYCVRPRRAGEVATFRLGQYGWVVCGRHNAAACTVRAASAAPRDHDEAWPRCRAHLAAEEEREGATLRRRWESASSPRTTTPASPRRPRRESASSPRPTTPASPRRPRRRRGTTARRGCGAARSSTPTGRASLDEPEADAGPIASPLPGEWRSTGMRLGEDGLRDNCCVRRRLHGDVSRRCVRAAAAGCVGDGERAGDVRRSLSAEPDISASIGEDIPRGNDSEDRAGRRLTLVDTSVVVQIGTPAEVGAVVRGGVKDQAGARKASTISGKDSSVAVLMGKPANGGTIVRGGLKKAAADVFLAGADRGDWMGRFTLAVEMGTMYWVQELVDWLYILKGSPRDRTRDIWSWHGVVGYPIEQHDDTCALCGTLVCLEARHRLDFERRHGFNTFPYRIPAETVANLKNLCSERGVWTVKYGADEKEVLKLIQEAGGAAVAGVPGWNPCRLQVKSWKYHRNSARQPIPQSNIAKLIYTEGPILGGLIVDKDYYAPGWEDRVYQGVPRGYKGGVQHLVVCTAYCKQPAPQRHWPDKTELIIEVVDNQEWDGPVRWILATAFTGFFEVHVEPLDAAELRVKKPSLWRRLLNTVSPRHRL